MRREHFVAKVGPGVGPLLEQSFACVRLALWTAAHCEELSDQGLTHALAYDFFERQSFARTKEQGYAFESSSKRSVYFFTAATMN